MIPVGTLPYRQGRGRGVRLSRSKFGERGDRIGFVRLTRRDPDKDTFVSVERAYRINELPQRPGQVRNLAPALITRAHDDTEYRGLTPGFICHRLDPIVCLVAGEGTRPVSTRVENLPCSDGATEHDSHWDRRQNPENNDFRDDAHNPSVLLSGTIDIVINDAALNTSSDQHDRVRLSAVRTEATRQQSGSPGRDQVCGYALLSVDRAACPKIHQREAVCQCQDDRQGYEHACEHDEHRLHAAQVPELCVDRVNASRALPRARNIDRIAASTGGMIQFSFQTLHGQCQLGIERVSIRRKMRTAMAIRADACDISDVVRASVTQSPDVMSFQIGAAARCGEWGWLTAAFTGAVCSLQHVIPHITAALKDSSGGLIDLRAWGCARGQCAQPQVGKHRLWFWLTGQVICFKIRFSKRGQPEDYRFAVDTLDVGLHFRFPARAHEYAVKADSAAFPLLREDEQIFAVLRMVADSAITRTHFHRPTLALPRVTQAAVGFVLVSVSDNASAVSCEDKDAGKGGGGRDASLLLTAVARVDLLPTVVGLMDYEGPVHRRTLHREAQARKPEPYAEPRLAA
ncbi:hypothetical protein NPJ82_09110 [Sphingomonas sp. NY01]|uniref:hypothetical protein n=1 Tax=Sphingomonas sp. NY01 TaxID=2968057 RepID=UPI00315CC495